MLGSFFGSSRENDRNTEHGYILFYEDRARSAAMPAAAGTVSGSGGEEPY